MSTIPFPTVTPAEDPQAWRDYWAKVANVRTQASKAYRKAYYANKTKLRQIDKLKELIDKYPNEAKSYVKYRHLA